MTCHSCPEQYDVMMGKVVVGYLRLRHGHFTARYPDAGGRIVYEAHTDGDGMFTGDERMTHIVPAVSAIRAAIAKAKEGM
jgi:hypothetical protein